MRATAASRSALGGRLTALAWVEAKVRLLMKVDMRKAKTNRRRIMNNSLLLG